MKLSEIIKRLVDTLSCDGDMEVYRELGPIVGPRVTGVRIVSYMVKLGECVYTVALETGEEKL